MAKCSVLYPDGALIMFKKLSVEHFGAFRMRGEDQQGPPAWW